MNLITDANPHCHVSADQAWEGTLACADVFNPTLSQASFACLPLWAVLFCLPSIPLLFTCSICSIWSLPFLTCAAAFFHQYQQLLWLHIVLYGIFATHTVLEHRLVEIVLSGTVSLPHEEIFPLQNFCKDYINRMMMIMMIPT